MNSPTFTNKSDIRIGFEIECVVKDVYKNNNPLSYYFQQRKSNDIFNRFKKELNDLPFHVVIAWDGSIEHSDIDRAVELKTTPLPPKDAIRMMEAIFVIVNKFGYTNSSCGLHVNISSIDKSKMINFNPLPFIYSKLWNEILSEFKRSTNEYCRPIIGRSTNMTKIRQLTNILNRSNQKYRCVNLTHFGNGQGKQSRIEIRGMGNKNYSNKFDKIVQYIKRIERLFNLCCSRFSETRSPEI